MSRPQSGFDFGDAENLLIARRRFPGGGSRSVRAAVCERSADPRVSGAGVLFRSEGFGRVGLGSSNRRPGRALFTRFDSGSGIAVRSAGIQAWKPKRRIGVSLILTALIARLDICRR